MTLNGTSSNAVLHCGDALAFLQSLPDDFVDVAFTSPPYTDARTYGVNADRDTVAWVEWMRPIVREMCRVSKGVAFLNVSDRVEGHRYKNGPEWLHADLTRMDGLDAIRPYVWVKSGPDFDDSPASTPGSGGKHFHRNDYEPIYGYAESDKLPPHWSDQTAFGTPPKCGPGGPTSHRDRNGVRKGAFRKEMLASGELPHGAVVHSVSGKKRQHTKRLANGAMETQVYIPPDISNPGNVIRARVGGGQLGHPLAHEGEAPMPLAVAERFVCWFCPPGGRVLDPFCGSGTTAHAAIKHGRGYVCSDLRQSQIDLTRRRLSSITPDMFAMAEASAADTAVESASEVVYVNS